MTKRAALSCGHTVTLTEEALRIIENTGTLRCPRCGRTGLPAAPGSNVGPSPLIARMREGPRPMPPRSDPEPRRSGEPRRPAAATPAPTPPPPPPVPEPAPEPPPPAPAPPPAAPAAPAPAAPVETTARVVIGGGPRTGKTTFSEQLGVTVRHTDDLIDTHEWSAVSAEVAEWMAAPGPWVIEGVAAVRALRKRMDADPGAPCDLLVWMRTPLVERSTAQDTMAKGCETVLTKILPELRKRGVQIEYA